LKRKHAGKHSQLVVWLKTLHSLKDRNGVPLSGYELVDDLDQEAKDTP